ncbi:MULTISPECIES: mannose-1-phosphate guanylyltransferase/mannose-6-phosphate isomerase [Mesorhizobium]|uniref:mannose-1-phosphate guanylyltransferase/mannose-6-phosphate isomerase n=1 Tax=Mesorhizobium TaxID=68287 RepID=UPI00131418B4|nr:MULTISPECIES: mannose-1-phosphate guanylyltransferase/mannose-6-phosphate isomerase [Mesorhizobium]
MRITPVILAAGVGTRLWPLSQVTMPKQFLPLLSDGRSTFQAAIGAVSGEMFGTPIVMTQEAYRWIATEQARAIGRAVEFVLEPPKCGTALAVSVAAHQAKAKRNGGLCLVLASDHNLQGQTLFEDDCRNAVKLAARSHIAIFGIEPDHPSSDYGYIELGQVLHVGKGYSVKRFVEKPDQPHAMELIRSGCLWNSGNMLFDTDAMIAELAKSAPNIAAAAQNALANAVDDNGALILPERAAQGLNAISIDYALLERTSRAAVVRASFGWSDMGTWQSVFDLGAKDPAGNVTAGQAHLIDTRDSLVFSDGRRTAVIGLNDVAVVATPQAILVADVKQSSKIKDLLPQLSETDAYARTYRPWGWFERLGGGPNFQVKQLVVKRGAALSLQLHHHRDEHWTVVQGVGEITVGSDTGIFEAGSNVYIARESIHRLRNMGDAELIVIEVQTGSYLGEDDIVRFEDLYDRV